MFEKIIGHNESKKILENDIVNGKVSHAYLFSGIEGIGKRELALEFAKELLNTEHLNACIDFKYIEKAEDSTVIKVEQIRKALADDVHIAPATCDRKVYIINDAHLMNEEAQNAILKTLEEPPSYVVIILVTHTEQQLLTTVMSRVKLVKFSKLDEPDLDVLTDKITGKKLDVLKHEYANGSLKIALELLKDDNKYDKIKAVVDKITFKDKLGTMNALAEVSFKDEETFKYFEYIFLRNKMYSLVPIVEYAKNRMNENGNEDMIKTAFMLKVLRKE
ncbi:MAG: DNA polymerase III subunit delta' [Clostridia bacterium]|nr:DNA polymerase III subunit delta' [Clostridia bacterium]